MDERTSGQRTTCDAAYEANALTIALRDLISIEHLKVDRFFPEGAIKLCLYVVDVVKRFVVYYILLTLYSL